MECGLKKAMTVLPAYPVFFFCFVFFSAQLPHRLIARLEQASILSRFGNFGRNFAIMFTFQFKKKAIRFFFFPQHKVFQLLLKSLEHVCMEITILSLIG